jgi:iron complex outermembrane recepter protein
MARGRVEYRGDPGAAWRWLLVGLLVLCLPLVAAAQGPGRITGSVADATGAVLPGVTVTARAGGITRTAVTDANGKYTIDRLDPGAWEVIFELVGFERKTSQVTVTAGQAATVEAKLEIGGRSEAVQVTGTLIPRPTLEAMSPVTTLEVEELTYRGMTRIEDLLTTLPQVFTAQNSTVSNGSSGTATVDLRGLGSQRTLVLLDGRRMSSGDAFTTASDLNFIPSALVKRVDVLTGGASSVYGADAVAGVVNFVLDKDFEGVRGGVQVSGYQHNNRNEYAQSINAAKNFNAPTGSMWNGGPMDFNVALGGKFGDGGKGHATVYLDYRYTAAITKDARDYTNCSVSSLNTSPTATGPLCGGSGTWQYGRFLVYPAVGSASKDYVLDVNSPNGDQFRARTAADVYNYAPLNFMQRPDKRWAGGGFLNYDWSKQLKAYGEFMFMDDYTDAQIAPSGDFGNTDSVNCNNPLLSAQQRQLLCTNMGYGPNDIANVYIYRRNVEGGGRVSKLRHTDWRTSWGLKGDLNPVWSYDGYFLWAQVNSPQEYANDFNATAIQDALLVGPDGNCLSGNTGCVPWNIFKKGGVTQAALDYMSLAMNLMSGTRTALFNGRVTADFKDYGWVSPKATEGIKAAFGVEYRDEYLYVHPDQPFREGAGAGQGGPTLPVEGAYDVMEFYSEGVIPFVQDVKFAKDLSLEVGYRVSNYSSTGTHSTYKFQGSWAPTSDVKLRLGYNRATRSPNIRELYTPQGLGLGGSQDICAGDSPSATRAQCALQGVSAAQYGFVPENPAGQYNTIGGGNPDLSPERADTYTIGAVFTPKKLAGFSATLDYYDIKIDDTIGNLGPEDIQNQCAKTGDTFLCGLIHRDKLGSLWATNDGYTVTTNQNVGMRQSRGMDFTGNYSHPVGDMGLLSVNLIGTWLFAQKIDTGLYNYDCVGYFGDTCDAVVPEWRHMARFSWETNWKFVLSVGWRMIGPVTNDWLSPEEALAVPGQEAVLQRNQIDKIPAFNYMDMGVTYNLRKGIQVVGGINNVFDKEPPLGAGQQNNDYGAGFYGFYDSLGRFLHASIQFTF